MEEINKIITVKKGNRDYPESLSTLEDAPETLYCIGNISLMKKTCIAVVGSRKCTEYGKQTAMNIGKTAAQNGIVTVSGMAKGIDSFAHIGALRSGGETIAVLGCGPDVCYPASNRSLYEEIKEKGLIVSEIEPGKAPMPYMFPMPLSPMPWCGVWRRRCRPFPCVSAIPQCSPLPYGCGTRIG